MFNTFKLATFVGIAVLFSGAIAYGQETSAERAQAAVAWTQDTDENAAESIVRDANEFLNLRWAAGDKPGVYSIQAVAEEPSPYLIGVHCEAAGATEFLSKDVGGLITVQGGLKINQVSKDSPAEKIGMLVNDIILIVEGKTVAEIDDLVAIVNEKGEKEINGMLIRGQHPVEFDLTPIKRPEEKEEKANPNQFSVNRNLYWYMPNQSALPQGYQVTVELQSGSQPNFTIKKGENTWKTTGGEVSKLPKETKPFVAAAAEALVPLVTEKNRWSVNAGLGNYYKLANQPQRYLPALVAKRAADDEKEVARKLDELQKQISELTKIVSELKKDD